MLLSQHKAPEPSRFIIRLMFGVVVRLALITLLGSSWQGLQTNLELGPSGNAPIQALGKAMTFADLEESFTGQSLA